MHSPSFKEDVFPAYTEQNLHTSQPSPCVKRFFSEKCQAGKIPRLLEFLEEKPRMKLKTFLNWNPSPSPLIMHYEGWGQQKKLNFCSEIKCMMHVFGDVSSPLHKSGKLMHHILQDQMNILLEEAEAVARHRGGRIISYIDILFLMRKNKIMLKRLFQFLEVADVQSCFKESSQIISANGKPKKGKRVSKCLQYLSDIEDFEGDLTNILFDKNLVDHAARKRLQWRNLMTKYMTEIEYEYFSEYIVKVSFCPKQSNERFKSWLLKSGTIKFNMTSLAVTIVHFLARETIAGIVDMAIYIKSKKPSRLLCFPRNITNPDDSVLNQSCTKNHIFASKRRIETFETEHTLKKRKVINDENLSFSTNVREASADVENIENMKESDESSYASHKKEDILLENSSDNKSDMELNVSNFSNQTSDHCSSTDENCTNKSDMESNVSNFSNQTSDHCSNTDENCTNNSDMESNVSNFSNQTSDHCSSTDENCTDNEGIVKNDKDQNITSENNSDIYLEILSSHSQASENLKNTEENAKIDYSIIAENFMRSDKSIVSGKNPYYILDHDFDFILDLEENFSFSKYHCKKCDCHTSKDLSSEMDKDTRDDRSLKRKSFHISETNLSKSCLEEFVNNPQMPLSPNCETTTQKLCASNATSNNLLDSDLVENTSSKIEGENNSLKTDGENNSSKTDGENNSSKTDGENISSKTDGKNNSSKTDSENISLKTDDENISLKTDGENISLKTDGENISSETDDENSSSKTDGENSSSNTVENISDEEYVAEESVLLSLHCGGHAERINNIPCIPVNQFRYRPAITPAEIQAAFAYFQEPSTTEMHLPVAVRIRQQKTKLVCLFDPQRLPVI